MLLNVYPQGRRDKSLAIEESNTCIQHTCRPLKYKTTAKESIHI